MKTLLLDYHNIKPNDEKIAMALGYFDGVHLGHQKLIKEARENYHGRLGVLTFDTSVASLIPNSKSKRVLSSLDDRFRIISKFGVDYYYVLHIDKDFLNKSAIDFIEMLKKLNVESVYVGSDYRFGKNQEGNIDLLMQHFDVHVTDLLQEDGQKVSTQEIVGFIEQGEIKKANELLGYNYLVTGTIVRGDGIGHTIGFPTMNIKLIAPYVYPKFGVYKCVAYISNVPHIAICNVGTRPTVNGQEVRIEVNLPHYNQENYGETISLEFIEFIRPEKKFSSLEELKAQIEKDVKKVF